MFAEQMNEVVFHVDVNSAYLAWEAVDRLQHGSPVDLRNLTAVIGGDEASRHGIVLAKSGPAKKYGILTGETLYAARQRCPGLIVIPPRYNLYMQCSSALIEILRQYSPVVQQYSIDEAFLSCYLPAKDPQEGMKTAHRLKEQVKRELGFTVNVGIGPNKLLAKMASEFEKPDKVHTLFHHEMRTKMWPQPIDELFFVGRATARKLRGYGIYTIGALAALDPALVHAWLKKPGLLIWQYANGKDYSQVTEQSPPIKSIGNSNTIAFDVTDRDTAHQILLALTETAAMRLRAIDQCTRVVAVAIRSHELFTYRHQRKVQTPLDSTSLIWHQACQLFDESWKGEPIRHLGVHLSELCGNDFYQLSIFDQHNEKLSRLDQTIDQLRSRFGNSSVFRGCFAHSPIRPLMGGVLQEQEEEYPMMTSQL